MNKLTNDEWTSLRATIGRRKKHRHLSVLEVVALLVRAKSYMSISDICKKTNREAYIIKQFIRIDNIIDSKVLNSITWRGNNSKKQISMTAAGFLGWITDKKKQKKMYDAIIQNNFTKQDVYEVVSLWKKTGKGDISICIKEVLDLKPKEIIQEAIMGLISSRQLQNSLSKLSQIERNKLLNTIIENQMEDLTYGGAILKTTKFIIIGDSDTLKQLNALKIKPEEIIEKELMNQLLNTNAKKH